MEPAQQIINIVDKIDTQKSTATREKFLKSALEYCNDELKELVKPHVVWIDDSRFNIEIPRHRVIYVTQLGSFNYQWPKFEIWVTKTETKIINRWFREPKEIQVESAALAIFGTLVGALKAARI